MSSSIRFCKMCKNMLYFGVSAVDKDSYIWKCRNCNHIENINKDEVINIVDTNFSQNDMLHALYINKYLKFDPTLPHLHNLKCSNEKCTKKEDEQNDVIYMKIDEANMTMLYVCTYCDFYWQIK
jgi:DNA-directed RNA polymerase subunit M/transcription elongation factor TFIIS